MRKKQLPRIEQEPIEKDINYKEKYFKLIINIRKIIGQMDDRCPWARSCCAGCNLLNNKIKKLKKHTLENHEKWE